MLVLQKIIKTEKKGVRNTVLENITFSVNKNEYLAIICDTPEARNALVKILTLIDDDYSGDYVFENEFLNLKNKNDRKDFRRHHLGLVASSVNLIDELTVEENIRLPYFYSKKVNGMAERTAELVDEFNLAHRKNCYSKDLSSLTKMRVALAQALVLAPELLIINHQPNELSPEECLEFDALLSSLNNKGLTLIVVTQEEIPNCSFHRKIHLHGGKIVTGISEEK